jgi:hypothetical protein
MLVGGTNPACAGQPVTLDAGPGWATYQWSPGGATTRMITVAPSATMSYSVTTTDGNGCSVTSQPMTVVVNSASYTPPAIQGAPANICPNGSGSAWIDIPSPDYATMAWTIQHGTILGGEASHSVSFNADSSAQPVVLTVTVADANGCPAQSSVTIPILTIAPPSVHTFEADVCPNGSGQVYVDGPASGSWSAITWTIEHGSLPYGNSSTSTSFTADGSGLPVVLHVSVRDYGLCEAQNSITIPIRTIPAPAIHTFEADVCPNGSGQVYVDGPASGGWSSISWTIEHGTLPYGSSSMSTSFTADGSGLPVVLHVSVRDYGLCEAQNSITIPIRTIPTPAIHTFEANVCPNGSGQVYVDGPASGGWSSISWTIEHGTLPYGSSSMSTSFTADGSGLPVVLTVHVRDYGLCEAQNSITIPIRTIPAPAIHTFEPNICPAGMGQVYVDGPPSNSWSAITWTIEHGSLPYGSNSPAATFIADGSGLPVVLHVSVRDYGLCEAQNSITIPIRAITPPSISFFASPVCPGNMSGASIDGPASGGNWSSIVWSIEHGSLPWGNNSLSVSFVPDSSGQPVVLHVTVRDYGTCEAQNSITIQVQAPTAVSIQSEYSTICTDGYGAATIDPPPPGHTWSFINWTVDHGSVYAGQGTTRLNFQADGSGNAVVVHVWAQQDGSSCPAQSSVSIPTRTLTPPVIALATGSCPTTASVTNAADYTQFMWNSDNATITSSTFEPSVTFLPFHNGHVTLTVVVRDGAGCEATSSVGYDVTGLPDITMTLPGVPYCYGTPATASIPDGGPGVTYQWSLNSGQFLGSSTMPTVSFIPQADTLALTVTATNAQGCSATGTTYVLVNRPPFATITASGPTTFCTGGSVTLTASSAPSYHWSNGATTQSITVSTAGSYTVTASNPNGCGSTSVPTVVAIVDPTVSITADGPLNFCEGGSVTLTANAGASYLWTTGATTRSIVVTQGGLYRVTVTNANGCSATSAPTVVTVNALPAATVTASGPTTFCAGGSVTLTASSGASYLWSNGAITPSITANSSGSYSVTVTSAAGCSATSAATAVTVNPVPAPHIVVAQQYSSLAPSGFILAQVGGGNTYTYCGSFITVGLTALGGGPGALVHWSSGQSTPHITVTQSGVYTVTMTNAEGCSADDTVVVNINPYPTATITAGGPLDVCPNGGSVVLTANAADSYLWSNGATTRSIVATQPGDYHVAVTIGGCTANSSDVTVTTRSAGVIAGGRTFCPGGSVTLTAPAGTSYAWSSGAMTQSISVSTAGDYSVTVADATGCHLTPPPATVTASSIAVSVTASATTICEGQTSTLTAHPTGGTGSYSYQWFNGSGVITGATSPTYAVTVFQGYYVVVTDAGGCAVSSVNQPVIVNVNPAPAAYMYFPDSTFCSGGTYTVSGAGTTQPTTFGWTVTNGTLQSASGNSAVIVAGASGSVTITMTATYNGNGCSNSQTQTIPIVQPPPVPVITASGPTTFCQGDVVTLTAPAGYSYNWRLGSTSVGSAQSLTTGAAGSYTVTVTNAGGCSTTSQLVVLTVTPLPNASITASGPTTFCAGGSVTLTASSGSSYLWSNGATTPSITASASGNYSVTVTNANGCSATSSPTTVTVNAMPVATITPGSSTTFCAGSSVSLTASAGSSYLWSNGATARSIFVNSGGNYSVTVTSNGCSTTSAPVTVTVNANPPVPVITANGPTTFCVGGSVTLTAPISASYYWSTGATTQSIVASTSGNYVVNVTDANGCYSNSAPTVVTVSALPTPSIVVQGPLTYCRSFSSTILNASPMTGTWYRNGVAVSTTARIFVDDYGTGTGSFVWRATNAAGCTKDSDPVVVTVNPAPSSSASFGFLCWNGTSDAESAETAPGTTYQWSVTNGTILSGAGTRKIVYAVTPNAPSVGIDWTVTSAAGCSSNPQHMDIPNDPQSTSISPSGPTTFCSGGSVVLTASAVPGAAYYVWSNGVQGPQSITVTAAGNYTVHAIKSGNGCIGQESAPVSVTILPAPTATITAGGPTGFCSGGSVTLTASSGASYLWSNGATTQSISATTSGNYSVTVTNASGCSATSAPTPVTVNANPSIPVVTAGGPTTFCPGGSVTLTASSGPYFHWSNGYATQSITVSTGGNYSVTVINDSGCSATSAPTTVTVNANPTATITAGGPTTFCAGGNVTLTASTASSYLWSTGATTQSITASATGNYSVTVTNASGCSAASAPTAVTVNANPMATITAGGPTTFCAGGSVTLTASSGSSYLWSTGATTQSISATASGNYTVTVTNASGCSAMASPTTVTVNASPTATITAGGPTTFCAGGSVTLTASSGASYLWSTGATTQSISANATGNYSVTVTNASGCSAISAPTAVTVNANPTATITAGGPTTFCAGGSVTLTASSGSSYLWSTGATTQSISANATGNYSVTINNASGCSGASAPVAVTAQPRPTATVSGGGAICPGGSTTITATLTGTAPWSVTWSDNVTQTINSGTTATRTVNPASNTTYAVTTLSDANCSGTSSGSAAVTIKTLPTATVSGGGAICAGNSATITATLTGSAPWIVTWSDNVTQNIGSGTTASRSVGPQIGTTYTVTSVSDGSGCSRAGSGSAVVTVKNVPTAVVSGGATICPGGSATITVALTGTAPWSVTWSDNVVQNIPSGSGATRSVSPAATTTYTVTTVTDASGCPHAGSGSATVTRNVAASITTQPSNVTTTRNTNVTLSVVAAGTPPISYQWFNGNGTTIAGATSSSYTTSFSKKGTNTFYVEVWNACNTTHVRSNTVTVTVN